MSTKKARFPQGRLSGFLLFGLLGLLLAGALFGGFLLNTQMAHALGVSPPTVDVGELAPGESKDFTITIFNPNAEGTPPVEMTVKIIQYFKDETGSLVEYTETTGLETQAEYYSMALWVTPLNGTSFVLPPQGQQKVEFRVTVPENVEPGEKFCGIAFSGISPGAEGNVIFEDVVLAQIFMHVGGERFGGLKIDPPILTKTWLCDTTIDYQVDLYNTGNTFLDIRELYLRFYHHGNLVQEESLGTPLLLPKIPERPGSDHRVITGTVKLPEQWRGYEVRVECAIPIEAQSPTVTIGTFPLWLLIALIVVGLILIGVAFYLYRRHRRKKGEGNGDKGKKPGKKEGSKEEPVEKKASSEKPAKDKQQKGKKPKVPPPADKLPEKPSEEDASGD